jgi:hypothetical protein
MILSPQWIAFQRSSEQVVPLSQERHFVTPLRAAPLSDWNANIAGGMSDTQLPPMNSQFGKLSRLGVVNETR